MIKGNMFFASLLLVACAAPVVAQQGGVGAPSRSASTPVGGDVRRAVDSDEIDEPAAPMKVSLPTLGAAADLRDPNAPALVEQVPTEDLGDSPSAPPTEGPQSYNPETIAGRHIWCIDRSSNMSAADAGASSIQNGDSVITHPTRMQIAKAESIAEISKLVDTDEFAIVTFGGCPGITWFNAMNKATPANKAAAISIVNQLAPFGFAGIYGALKRANQQYPDQTNNLWFLSNGTASYGPGTSAVLNDFPGWYFMKREFGCDFHVIHIGEAGSTLTFMSSLASANGGSFEDK